MRLWPLGWTPPESEVFGWHRMATQWMRVAFAIAPVGVRSLQLVGSSLALVFEPVQDVADLVGIHLSP